MFKRVGRKLIIDFTGCENAKEKIEAMQDVMRERLPTHRAKKVKNGIFEMRFYYDDMLDCMEEMLTKAFKEIDKKKK